MYVLHSHCGFPVRLAPEKQMMTSRSVEPLAALLSDWISEMGASRFPLNGAVTVLVAPEMLKVVPLGVTARKMAEPWYPDGQAAWVDQVGVPVTGPLAGFSATRAVPLPEPPPVPPPEPPLAAGEELELHAARSAVAVPTATAAASHLRRRPFLLLLLPNTSFILALIGLCRPGRLYPSKTRELGACACRGYRNVIRRNSKFESYFAGLKIVFSRVMADGN
jgi:hypothetical protein